jgi:hypothetical protein
LVVGRWSSVIGHWSLVVDYSSGKGDRKSNWDNGYGRSVLCSEIGLQCCTVARSRHTAAFGVISLQGFKASNLRPSIWDFNSGLQLRLQSMIYTYCFNGIQVSTGDVICTTDGVPDSLYGQFWRQVGRLLPGTVDHCAVYLGPNGRCVEAGPGGVIVYEMGEEWDSMPLANQRLFVDSLYGVAYPLRDRGLTPIAERLARESVAAYCLNQAVLEKPYNFNFPNPDTEKAFYCSQLVYKAYLTQGIDLNTNIGTPTRGPLAQIVFPEEIWHSCIHVRPVLQS